MKKKEEIGVLLDFDGTITKPVFDWPAMKKEMNLPDLKVSILDYISTANKKKASKVEEILERYEIDAAKKAELNEGAKDLVNFLKEKKIPHAIVTNNAKKHVLNMLNILNITFEKIVTRDIGFWKPDPRQAIAGAKKIGIPPKRCFFIGDGQYDMLAAARAGMISIHLSKSKTLKCNYQITNLTDAISIISSNCNK
ncbi:MAG: HAD family phosphatase [Nitrospinota bacterium]|nr:HAD family phosphatase [Nitrospinota bacterium]